LVLNLNSPRTDSNFAALTAFSTASLSSILPLTVPSWPACGEIDVVEYRGQEPGIANAALHGPGYSGGQAIDGSTAVAGGGLYKDFHIFAVEWSADEIVWLVDDYPYHRVTRESLPPLTSWVFDQPFFLLLNLAVGGSYVGPVGADTIFPQALVADYVRAYEVAP
jgi:beta-glucanase (GH16 family)